MWFCVVQTFKITTVHKQNTCVKEMIYLDTYLSTVKYNQFEVSRINSTYISEYLIASDHTNWDIC